MTDPTLEQLDESDTEHETRRRDDPTPPFTLRPPGGSRSLGPAGSRTRGAGGDVSDAARFREAAQAERLTGSTSPLGNHWTLGNLHVATQFLPHLMPELQEVRAAAAEFARCWRRVAERLEDDLQDDLLAMDELLGEIWSRSEANGFHAGYSIAGLNAGMPVQLSPRRSVAECNCNWGAEFAGDHLGRGRFDRAQELHDLLLDLEGGTVETWRLVLTHLVTDQLEFGVPEGTARVPWYGLTEFVAQHNWNDPSRMLEIADLLEVLCRAYDDRARWRSPRG